MVRPCPVWESARREPERIALRFEGREWTYAELNAAVALTASALHAQGVRPGSRVAIHSDNRPQVVTLFFALGRLGAALVLLNARLTENEWRPLFGQSQAERLFLERDLCSGKVELVPAFCGALPSTASAALAPTSPGIDPEQTVAALFTSGTTGQPKLIELTHANFFASAEGSARNLGGSNSQVWLGTLPLFHIGGLAMAHRCAVYGATLVLEPRFDAQRVSARLDSGVTHASFVPTTLERLLAFRGGRPWRGVEAVLVGGAPVGPSLLERARRAGLPVLQTYGLTEACSQVTCERPGEADGLTAGRPLAGLDVRVVDASGRALETGSVGLIEVRGATVARGLGPWLATKDLGHLDSQGRLAVKARRVDLIISGGENVYPAEVEQVLQGCPLIQEVAVVGRPDAAWGQVPVGVVVTSMAVDDDALTRWARQHLAPFKVPKVWVRAVELPRNSAGKVDRPTLLAWAAEGCNRNGNQIVE